MPLTPRTDLKNAWKRRTHRLGTAGGTAIFGSNDQVDGYLADSLEELSRVSPVKGKLGTATADDSGNVVLPVDWLIEDDENKNILRAIEDGRDPLAPKPQHVQLQQRSGVYGQAGYLGSIRKYDPTSQSLAPPLVGQSPSVGDPPVNYQLVGTAFLPVFVPRIPQTADREWAIRYNARYIVTDEVTGPPLVAAVNTLPVNLESAIFEMMRGFLIIGQANGDAAKFASGRAIIDAALHKKIPRAICI